MEVFSYILILLFGIFLLYGQHSNYVSVKRLHYKAERFEIHLDKKFLDALIENLVYRVVLVSALILGFVPD